MYVIGKTGKRALVNNLYTLLVFGINVQQRVLVLSLPTYLGTSAPAPRHHSREKKKPHESSGQSGWWQGRCRIAKYGRIRRADQVPNCVVGASSCSSGMSKVSGEILQRPGGWGRAQPHGRRCSSQVLRGTLAQVHHSGMQSIVSCRHVAESHRVVRSTSSASVPTSTSSSSTSTPLLVQ